MPSAVPSALQGHLHPAEGVPLARKAGLQPKARRAGPSAAAAREKKKKKTKNKKARGVGPWLTPH